MMMIKKPITTEYTTFQFLNRDGFLVCIYLFFGKLNKLTNKR